MDFTIDIHGRARKKRQQAQRGEAKASSDSEENNQQIGVRGGAKSDSVSTDSSLFGHDEDEQAKKEDMGTDLTSDPNFNSKASKPQDDSDSSLFSSSGESVKVVATVKPTIPNSPPSSVVINKANPSPSVLGVDRCQDDSDCSLFSHEDEQDQEETLSVRMVDAGAAASLNQDKTTPKPVYLTFDRPKYNPDESEESSDDGSLFSLNERKGSASSTPSITKTAKNGTQEAKSNEQLASIPRKKSPKPKSRHAQWSALIKKGAPSAYRPCHKFNRQQSGESHSGQPQSPEVKKKGVSFAATVKQTKKFVGKAARALEIAPPPDAFGIVANKTSPTKSDTEEEGIYYGWQKSAKEKAWNKQFVRVKKYLREHGNNDVPEGHSLSPWIRIQQRQCQKWIANFFNGVEGHGKEFQTFVHIYRLQRVGFEFGPRIDYAIESSIKDAAQSLDETMQKVLQSYGGRPSPLHVKKRKIPVIESTTDADEDYEFDDTVLDKDQSNHSPPKKKKMEEMRKPKKAKHKAMGTSFASSDGFIDERPKKISWNAKTTSQHAKMCRFQLTSVAQKKALEIYRESGNRTISMGNNIMRGCWYDLEHATLKQCNMAAIEDISVPKDSPVKPKPKRLWSEVEKLWSSQVELDEPNVITPHQPLDVAPLSIAKDTMVVTTEVTEATKSISVLHSANSVQKSAPASAPTEDMKPNTAKSVQKSAPSSTSTEDKKPNTAKSVQKSAPSSTSTEDTTAQGVQKSAPASTTTEDKKPNAALRSDDISMRPSEDFPGWFVRYVPRKSNGGDYYYYSPIHQFKLRSRPEVRRFIEILEKGGSEEDAMGEYKSSSKKTVKTADKASEKPSRTTDNAIKEISNGDASDIANPDNNVNSPSQVQKKVLRQGDEVYAPWRRSKKQKSPAFFSGAVVSTEVIKAGHGGCSRVYNVRFDDGDELNKIDEALVIPKDEYISNSFKHIYSFGDKVYSAWWPETTKRKASPAWYPGTIKGVRVQGFGGEYGPSVLYDVLFDDGDEHFNVEDHFVFTHSDYIFSTKQLAVDKSEWIGVRNVVDNTSTDPWAKVVGWYAAKINGIEQTYPLLTDALRAFDTHTAHTLGVRTQKHDLNIPDEWVLSKSKAPVRRVKVVQIAGRKLTPTEASRLSPSIQTGPSRTVKHHDHVLKWNSVKTDAKRNVSKFDSSDCDSDDFGNGYDTMTTSISRKKPEFKRGERVHALWPDENKWFPGRIWDINIKPKSDNGYGPERSFDIIYDDGEKNTGVKEIHVMKTSDYEVCMLKGEKDWIGVKNVTDPDSQDEFARTIGWYEVNFEGSNESFIFASLHEALRYYDKLLIMRKGTGAKISSAELNFPTELKAYLGLSVG